MAPGSQLLPTRAWSALAGACALGCHAAAPATGLGPGRGAAPVDTAAPFGLDTAAPAGDSGPADTGAGGAADSGAGTAPAQDPAPIVVIGGGPSGMAAAMDLGDVVLLEASERLGGRAPGYPGLMLFAGSAEQAAAGIEDSAAQAVADWPELTGAAATDVTTTWLEDSAGVAARLVELGMSFDKLGADPILGRERYHATAIGLDAVLAGQLGTDVDLRLLTRATGLRVEGGAVTGVHTDAGVLDARAVVIASGGFANRVDLVARFTTWDAGTWAVGDDDGAQGDAVDWADAASLGLRATEAIGANADAIGIAGTDGLATRRSDGGAPPWIWVDASGARFVDETETWSMALAGALSAHAPVWCLTTEEHLEAMVDAALVERVAAGAACADDWAALGEEVGFSSEGIAETLDQLVLYSSGSSDPLGRASGSFPHMSGRPCAFPPGLLASKNFGGLDVDADGRVLDSHGTVVRGLWAVGEAAGMGAPGMGGSWGFDGSLSAVVWSGWRTAAALAAEDAGR